MNSLKCGLGNDKDNDANNDKYGKICLFKNKIYIPIEDRGKINIYQWVLPIFFCLLFKQNNHFIRSLIGGGHSLSIKNIQQNLASKLEEIIIELNWLMTNEKNAR